MDRAIRVKQIADINLAEMIATNAGDIQGTMNELIAELMDHREAAQSQPKHGIGSMYEDVHAFHAAFGHPAHRSPVLQTDDRVNARRDWIAEEVDELGDALTIVDQADAYIDIIYFAIGGLVEIGVDPTNLWDIVHRANMAKVQPDGSVQRRPDGKIIKPEGWQAPEPQLVAEIERQVA